MHCQGTWHMETSVCSFLRTRKHHFIIVHVWIYEHKIRGQGEPEFKGTSVPENQAEHANTTQFHWTSTSFHLGNLQLLQRSSEADFDNPVSRVQIPQAMKQTWRIKKDKRAILANCNLQTSLAGTILRRILLTSKYACLSFFATCCILFGIVIRCH